jgi:hypothetical protein
MTLAGLTPILKSAADHKRSTGADDIASLGFFGGAALLSAFSFIRLARTPSEHMPSTPLERGRLWSARIILLATAILSAAFVSLLGQTLSGALKCSDINTSAIIEPPLVLLIVVSSMAFWILLTGSIFRGVMLTVAAQFLLYVLLVLLVRTIDTMAPGIPYAERLSHQPEVHSALLPFVVGCGSSYAALMLWLARRRFAAADSAYGIDSHIAVPTDLAGPKVSCWSGRPGCVHQD